MLFVNPFNFLKHSFKNFVNTSTQPLSITKIRVEYMNEAGVWTPMKNSQAGYNEGVLVTRIEYGRLITERDFTQDNYKFFDTFNLASGVTVEYVVASNLPCEGTPATMYPAKSYVPRSKPYPLNIKLLIQDSEMKKREIRAIYTAPYKTKFERLESFKNLQPLH